MMGWVASERFEMESAGGERERLLMKSKTQRDQSLLQSPTQFTVAFFCKLNKAIEKVIGDTLLDILLVMMGLSQNEEKQLTRSFSYMTRKSGFVG